MTYSTREKYWKKRFLGAGCGWSDLRQTGVRRQLRLYPGDWLVRNKGFLLLEQHHHVKIRVRYQHHFNVEPDTIFILMLIRILIFTLMRIQIPVRILLFIKVMWICNHCTGLLTLQGSILSLYASIVSIHGPLWLYCQLLKILNFEFNADPDPAFHSNVDPACHNNTDPCGFGSATLEKYTLEKSLRPRTVAHITERDKNM